MATIKAVNYSMNGEQPTVDTPNQVAEAVIVNDLRNEGAIDQQQTQFHVFKLVANGRNGGVYIPNVDDVLNPATITKENPKGNVERMRLLAGFPSVWMKDQKDLTPEYVRQNQRSLHFVRGTRMIQIPDHDQTALTFARLCSHNIGSKSKKTGSPYEFYEFDAALEEKKAFEREDFELEMAILAKKADLTQMKKHAAFLGIRLANEYGLAKGEDGIRMEYVRYAKKNPDYFKKTINSKQVEIGWTVMKAISEGLIEINREPGKIHWANGGGIISAIPPQIDPAKYLVDLAMTNSEDGKKFLEQLNKTVK